MGICSLADDTLEVAGETRARGRDVESMSRVCVDSIRGVYKGGRAWIESNNVD